MTRPLIALLLVLLLPACAEVPRGTIDEQRSIEMAEGERWYRLFVPADVEEPVPLVLVFHGLAGEPSEVRALTGFDDLARDEGFAVAYPAGAGLIPGWRTDAGRVGPDAAFAEAVIEDVASVVGLDRGRIHAAGMSNGGGMAGRLVCPPGTPFGSVGVVAAAHGIGACAQGSPIPVIAFHGDSDVVVPIDGIPFFVQDPRRWIAARATANGCSAEPEIETTGAIVVHRYLECDADVIFYLVEGGRHGWPGSDRAIRTGDSATEIDATRLMWEFFAEHPAG